MKAGIGNGVRGCRNNQMEHAPAAAPRGSGVDRLPGLGRFAPLSGAAAAVLAFGGVVVSFNGEPDQKTGQNLAAWYLEDTTTILIGASLFYLAMALLIWFGASLRSRVVSFEGWPGRLGTLIFAGAMAVALMMMASLAPHVSAAFTAEGDGDIELTPEMAEVFFSVGGGFFLAAMAGALILFVATALATFRYRAFPTWFGVLSVIPALVLLFPPVGWAVLIFGLPIWLLIASVLLSLDSFSGSRLSPSEPA